MKKIAFVISLYMVVIFAACSPKLKGGYYSHKTECVSLELDGNVIVNAWANTGETKSVIEQAKKNALNDVLFGGVMEGKSGCNVKPILTEVNIKSKYEEYFNVFFSNSGAYKDYVSLKEQKNEKDFLNDKNIAQKLINTGLLIRINTATLKQKMINDNILKP